MDETTPPPSTQSPYQVPKKYPDEPEYSTYGKAKKRRGHKLVITLVVIVVLAAAGAGGYLFWHKSQKAPAKTTGQAQQAAATLVPTPTPVPTTHYDSADYNLGLDYPTGWNLSDPAGGKLTAISPVETLTSATGDQTTAKILLTIQNQQTSLPDFTAGNAVAVLASVKVAYKHPTSTQRANTYISYVQYAATTANGALDGLYVTGDNGYQKGQAIPQSDITGVNPLITVTFLKCTTAACSATTALSIQASSWPKSQLATTTQAMLQSLALN
jgi:hypothetical protein